jgi:hypothetical protein
LIPRLELFDDRGQHQEFEVLVNGDGELLIQLRNIRAETQLWLAISAGSEIPQFQQGNYHLNVLMT